MEWLARRIKESTLRVFAREEEQLAAMASDPEIRRELQRINEEFFPPRVMDCSSTDGRSTRGDLLCQSESRQGKRTGRSASRFGSIHRCNQQTALVLTVVVGTKCENIARDYSTNVRISPQESGLPLETVFLCFQLHSLDAARDFPPAPREDVRCCTVRG
jgi:hypothetical protein